MVAVHRLAVVTVAATVFLLFVGAIVTSKGVGLAVPDWPTTFGHNMFLFPWARMVGGVFYEHSHRLVASSVGLLTLILAVLLWIKEPRRWVRWLGAAALILVIIQGVVGGMRVVFLEQWFAVIHAGLAQAFFGLILAIAIFTSATWEGVSSSEKGGGVAALRPLCLITTVLIYLQALLGALIRHTGIAIELHVIVALLVAVHVFLLVRRALYTENDLLKRTAAGLAFLLVVQITLGVGSYLVRFSAFAPEWPPGAMVVLTTSHVVTGALMLGVGVALTLWSFRLLEAGERSTARVTYPQRASA